MDKVLYTSTSVSYSDPERTQELNLAWRTGEKTKYGVYVYLTPVVDAEVGCSNGTLTGGYVVDEKDEPEYVEWEGTRYGLAEGNVDVKAEVFKVFSGKSGSLTVDMEKLEITSKFSFIGIVKITKNNQSKKYFWKPANTEEESTALVWAYYESLLKEQKSQAITQVSWPPDSDNTSLSLSVGKRDTKEQCVYIYQVPNVSAVERGCDLGSLSSVGVVNNKSKDIFTVWNGNSISLPDGCVSCSVSVYKVYDGDSGGITVNIGEGIATSVNEWNGIVKMTTVTESKKLKWVPPDPGKRSQAVVYAYRKGNIALVNVEWIPSESEVDLRIELGQKGSKEGTEVPLKEIKLRMYPASDEITLGCTTGSLRRGQKIIESKTKYLEFQLVPLPDIHGTDTVVWEPDDAEDSSDVSKVSLGKGLIDVAFEPLDCYDRSGESVGPEVYYETTSGNAVGDQSFYGLVKATYKEEYQELIYQQAYEVEKTGMMSIKTGYVYGRLGEKAAFCEVPWDTNLQSDRKELYSVYSYYVRSEKGTFEYPDNWLSELEGEVRNLDRKTYKDWETLLDSRETGTFAKDSEIQINPKNCAIEKRVHRTANYNFIGQLELDNNQPIYGSYFKPYTDVKPSPYASYKPKYFVEFAVKPEVYDGRDEFGDQVYSDTSEAAGTEPLYVPSDGSTEALKKAWQGAYLRFNKDLIYESLLKEFPGIIRIPDVPEEGA